LAPRGEVEFNIEGNPYSGPRKSDRIGISDYPGFIELVKEIRPAQCTLVPDGDAQLTSDHGFDLRKDGDTLAPLIEALKSLGIRTSLFMDPDPAQIKLAAQTGADVTSMQFFSSLLRRLRLPPSLVWVSMPVTIWISITCPVLPRCPACRKSP
jgi:hypothetical protein